MGSKVGQIWYHLGCRILAYPAKKAGHGLGCILGRKVYTSDQKLPGAVLCAGIPGSELQVLQETAPPQL